MGIRDWLRSRVASLAAFLRRSLFLLMKCEGFRNSSAVGVGWKHSAANRKLKANGGESQQAGLATLDLKNRTDISSVKSSRTEQHFLYSGSVL